VYLGVPDSLAGKPDGYIGDLIASSIFLALLSSLFVEKRTKKTPIF
jgi:hypothetical protein